MGKTIVDLAYRYGETRQSVQSLQAHLRRHQLEGSAAFRPGQRLTLSGQGARTWYADGNARFDVIGTARLHLRRAAPSLAVEGRYQYQDATRLYPDSRPYWTPDQLTTLAAGGHLDLPLTSWLEIGGTYGGTSQNGVLGHDYGARLRLEPFPGRILNLQLERFGSGAYAYRAASLQFTLHF
jgi:hypothetical protein